MVDQEDERTTPGLSQAKPEIDIDDRRPRRLGLWLMATGFGGFLLWASLAPLDAGVVASATVNVTDNRKTIQHLTGGSIKAILVREGDRVRRDQPLIELDPTRAIAEQGGISAQYIVARTVENRLQAERDGLDRVHFDPELLRRFAGDPRLQDALGLQARLFATRRSALTGEAGILKENIRGAEEQLKGLRQVQAARNAQIQLLNQELEGVRHLAAEGYVARNRLLELERNAAELIDQATARRDLAQAELIEAQDGLIVALRLLQEMLGGVPERLASLHREFPTPALQPASLQDWLGQAQANNPTLRAQHHKQQEAEEEVRRVRSGHWPTLDLVLGYTDSESDSISTLDQQNRYATAGVELNMPLFAGGGVSARVRQAVASHEQSIEELNATREEVLSATTRQFRGVQSGQARIRALERAVASSERAQDSAKKGFLAGSSTNLDILNAEEQVFIARRDLLEAKLRYLQARLQLAEAVGLLGDDDIDQANAYLGPELALTY
ncbi:TolC family protein [Azotobacter chroococcum]|uniref:Type I secretion outer membrane protein, TolC family n=1 Tax=Azotobacter chroococcum NCIMB 8003 TaxID=1328314 RepID=A0A0C4WMR9_9GAMM|nr:TolC family protein [Azotobacter chroococcum]AJE21744.1 Type I secretion outer membrane protein, TolC family [Azotobacter chroococcum NCIMB 8003]